MDLVIYGAQGIGLGAYKAIKELFPDREILCFLVTTMGNNALTLGGLPVIELAEFVSGMSQEKKDNIEVMIATPESVMSTIEKSLDEAGLHSYVRLDSIRWGDMQRLAFVKSGKKEPLSAYPIGYHKPLLQVYKMVHYKDKPLKSTFINPEYMRTVQVGAAGTKIMAADFADNSGDNISEKNGNYSELTGLYWLWKNQINTTKNSTFNYYGLCHYRRVFDLSEDNQLRLVDNDIDVVLPYAMPYEPNIEVHHERYLTQLEWSAVLQALNELQPEYAEVFKDILKQEYLYNYNIIIAKWNILSDYCEWLFPILFRIEEINDSKGIKEPNRFIGYVGEILETLYFMYNKKKYRITHESCRFLL